MLEDSVQDSMLRDRRVQVVGGAILLVVVTAVATVLIARALSSTVSLGDRLVLSGGPRDSVPVDLPLTAAEAVAAGWEDPIICLPRKGRYFRKEIDGQLTSQLLMYNNEDQLLGIYMISKNEMPPPWERVCAVRGVPELEYEHWAMEVLFRSPKLACGARKLGVRMDYTYLVGKPFGSC